MDLPRLKERENDVLALNIEQVSTVLVSAVRQFLPGYTG